jgi:phytoene synthase
MRVVFAFPLVLGWHVVLPYAPTVGQGTQTAPVLVSRSQPMMQMPVRAEAAVSSKQIMLAACFFGVGWAAQRRAVLSVSGQMRASVRPDFGLKSSKVAEDAPAVNRPILKPDTHGEVLKRSYEKCREITEIYAKTFYFGTMFFEEEKRDAIFAIYAWCRRLDDIVDKPRSDVFSLREELEEWTRRLQDIFDGVACDEIDLALVDTVQKYPGMTIEPYEDMIKGMVMDLDQNRFETFDELYLYCYRVAGTVGLMMMPIMGTEEGYTIEEASKGALALGVGLQLTNILRDVGEDRARKRIYVPLEDLKRFGVTEQSLMKGEKDEKYVAMMKFQIERARKWYMEAEDSIPMLSKDCQLPIRASLDMYSAILNKIEQNDYDNFNKRAYTAKWEKLLILPFSFWRVSSR